MSQQQNDYLSDAALVSLALQGDDSAMAKLISVAMPIARAKAVAEEAKNARLAADDLVQEGMLGFLNALQSYSAEGGASFRTYVGVCIANRIRSAVRTHNNDKNLSLTSAVSIADEDSRAQSLGLDPQEIVAGRERLARLKALLCNPKALSPLERNAVALRLKGKQYSEIAVELGVSPKAVDNAIQRVKKKMRTQL